MRILILQFASDARGRPVPRFEAQLGTLMAILRSRGHTLGLAGMARFRIEAIKAALARSLPQLIYADISPVCTDVARRTLQYMQEHEFVPVVAGGLYAALDPSACLSLPGVKAAAVGESDAAIVTYLERIKDPAVGQVVQGVWLRDERGLTQPALPPLIEDLDSLPFPERELFDYAAAVRRTGEIEIAVGRGCPQRCSYCSNPGLRARHEARGAWVRRRTPEHVIEEIDRLRARYADARSMRFLDHAFALDRGWLRGFLAAYRRAVAIPFRCHVRANATDAELAAELAESACRRADVEVISGSSFIRDEVFAMDVSGEQLETAFAALRTAGIATRAIVYLGAPYESEASLDETLHLLRRLRPDQVDARPYFPWPGTPAEALCRQHGWLHSRGAEQLHAEQCGLDMPACRPAIVAAALRRMRAEFPTTLGDPWWRRWSTAARSALAGWLGK